MAHRDLPNLDLLRSVAVLSVVLEHTLLAMHILRIGHWQTTWIGVVGVMMFFVHTSLVLMWSLERMPDPLNFYIRRVFRIYPLAWAAILAVLIFHAPTEGSSTAFFQYIPPTLKSVSEALLLIQNFYGGRNYVGVLWSLPYEVQMYILLPVLFFFVRKNLTLWPLLLIWLLTVVFCSTTFTSERHNLAIVIPYFLPGIMAYVGFERFLPRLPAWTFLPFLLLLTTGFMARPNWFGCWYLCLALGLALPFFQQIGTHWLKRLCFYVAQYSYGIYLVHPFSIVLGFYLLAGHSLVIRLAVEILTLIPISVASYHFLERPMIRIGSRVAATLQQRVEAVQSVVSVS